MQISCVRMLFQCTDIVGAYIVRFDGRGYCSLHECRLVQVISENLCRVQCHIGLCTQFISTSVEW